MQSFNVLAISDLANFSLSLGGAEARAPVPDMDVDMTSLTVRKQPGQCSIGLSVYF
jgi:hypothetical protein